MRILYLTLIMGFALNATLWGQTAPVKADETIYEFADTPPIPLIKNCLLNLPDNWNADSIRRCGELSLMALMANNIQYPAEARDKKIQGTVVLSFVVETTGRISNVSVLRDIGGGCGPEAQRVLMALDTAGLRWQPAQKDKQPVRYKQNMPMRFKLQEALPYYVHNTSGDTIYTNVEEGPQFKGGVDSLINFVFSKTKYPADYKDSCKTGIVEMALILRANGSLAIDNTIDFSNLGMDFQWEALSLARKTAGMWTPAKYSGKPVATNLSLRAVFKSDNKGCAAANDQFDKSILLSAEANDLLEQEKPEEAIAKWNEALKLHPNDAELLYYRGTALLNLNKREEACKDYNQIKQMLGFTWFEDIRRLVCGW